MRIVSGQYGGRRILVPSGRDIRPTTDKVRGAMFNMLAARDALQDAVVLDAFCGTGALGLEALSRGAKHCTFFDQARDSIGLAKENADLIGASQDSTFILKNALKIMPRSDAQAPYDLIFLDPPYHKGFAPDTLSMLIEGDWISPGGWIVCETEKSESISSLSPLVLDDERQYGEIKVTLFHYPITPE